MTINLMEREIEIRKTVLILLIISISVILGGIGILITRSGRDIIIEDKSTASASDSKTSVSGGMSGTGPVLQSSADDLTNSSENTNETNGAKQVNDSIKVYVVGCVKKPGVITLKKGQIIDDAVKSAGGLTSDADASSINMVYILNENVMLHICSKKEAAKSNQTVYQVPASSSGSTPTQKSSSNQAGSGIRIIKDAGSAVVSGQNAGQGASPVNGSGKININTASAAELDTLPGIGEATANDIISYREKNGPFKDIKDIMKIPRIKDSRFNAIKDPIAGK